MQRGFCMRAHAACGELNSECWENGKTICSTQCDAESPIDCLQIDVDTYFISGKIVQYNKMINITFIFDQTRSIVWRRRGDDSTKLLCARHQYSLSSSSSLYTCTHGTSATISSSYMLPCCCCCDTKMLAQALCVHTYSPYIRNGHCIVDKDDDVEAQKLYFLVFYTILSYTRTLTRALTQKLQKL